MIDLKENTSPIREQRANGINAYFGKASELVKDSRDGNLVHRERAFQQNSGCILNFYLTVRVATIRDAVMIMHAPVGCSSPALLYREVYRRIPAGLGRPEKFDFHWLTTNFNEKDVVFGAVDKLKFAIQEAENRYHPKAIIVLTSCTSGIIGEDIEGVVNDIQPEINATIVPVHCEGVRSRIVQTGYDAFWHAILKYLVKKPQKKQKDLVNVASMLSYTWQDRMEITRLLGKLGLRANFIPEFASVEQFEMLSEAAVTAPLCPTYTEYLSKGLEQEYGVPYFLNPSPVGIKNTSEWLRKIAYYTGKESLVEKVIAAEENEWAPKMEAIRNEFQNIKPNGEPFTVLGSLGQGRLLTQTPYFHELGLSMPVTICQDFDDLVVDDVEKLVEEVGDFEIVVNTFQAAEVSHTARKHDPDMVLSCPFMGSAYKREKGQTRIHALRGDGRKWSTQAGYTGAVACGSFLLQSTKNKAFQKTMLEKTQDPYHDWWFEQPNTDYYLGKKE
ncbi:MAG TPA: nitrogenase component 1 [Desulfosporosinus sp.]|nr:nitrogenase component 1 [Desulfosporosinus sp.]